MRPLDDREDAERSIQATVETAAAAVGVDRRELAAADTRSLLKRRISERIDDVLTSTGLVPKEVNPAVVTLRNGTSIQQISGHVLRIGGQDFKHVFLARSEPPQGFTQHDLNELFLPFGWSCTLGNGKNAIRVTAYEGRRGKEADGAQILVVKDMSDRMLRVMRFS